MFGSSRKNTTNIDPEQYEMMKRAEKRIKVKKRLYNHFILFILGSVLLVVLNKVFNYGEELFENWFLIAITLWGFLFVFHFIQVFITNRFLGKEWEAEQIKKLVGQQRDRIEKIKKTLIKEEQLMAQSELFNEQRSAYSEIQETPNQETSE